MLTALLVLLAGPTLDFTPRGVARWLDDIEAAGRAADPVYAGLDLARFDGPAPDGRLRPTLRVSPGTVAVRSGGTWAPVGLDALPRAPEVALAVESLTPVSEVRAVLVQLRVAGTTHIAWVGRPWDGPRLPPAPDPTFEEVLASGGDPAAAWAGCALARNFHGGLAGVDPARRRQLLREGVPMLANACDPRVVAKILTVLRAEVRAGEPVAVVQRPLAEGVRLPDTMPWSAAAPRVVRAGGLAVRPGGR